MIRTLMQRGLLPALSAASQKGLALQQSAAAACLQPRPTAIFYQQLLERAMSHDSASTSGSSSTPPSSPPQQQAPSSPAQDSRQQQGGREQVFSSASDDKAGVQKNWFTSLYKQLNYLAKTGAVPGLKGRQQEVFQQVEREFEVLYGKYVVGKTLDEVAHRSMLMCCLSVATYRVLNDEVEDTTVVRDVIRTNLGGVMLAILRPVHRFKLWVLRWLLREDMYRQAVSFLPAVQQDMGALCSSSVQEGEGATTMTVSKCCYHEILTKEDAPFLLSEFCCHHALLWLHEFRKQGVVVSMDKCMAWDDNCCQLRIARTGKAGLSTQPLSEQQEGGGK